MAIGSSFRRMFRGLRTAANSVDDEVADTVRNTARNKFRETDEVVKRTFNSKEEVGDMVKRVRSGEFDKPDIMNFEAYKEKNFNGSEWKTDAYKESRKKMQKESIDEFKKTDDYKNADKKNKENLIKERRADFNKQYDSDFIDGEYSKYAKKEQELFDAKGKYKIQTVDVTDTSEGNKLFRDAKFDDLENRDLKNSDINNKTQKVNILTGDDGTYIPFERTMSGTYTDSNGTVRKVNTSDNMGLYGTDFSKSQKNRMNKLYEKQNETAIGKGMKTAVGIGTTGGIVLAMSNNKGQQSNQQLYGQY